MSLVRSFVDLSRPSVRGAFALSGAAAAIALIPLAAIAHAFVHAAHAAPDRATIVAVTCAVVAAAALQIPLAAAGSRLLRAWLDDRAEAVRAARKLALLD